MNQLSEMQRLMYELAQALRTDLGPLKLYNTPKGLRCIFTQTKGFIDRLIGRVSTEFDEQFPIALGLPRSPKPPTPVVEYLASLGLDPKTALQNMGKIPQGA